MIPFQLDSIRGKNGIIEKLVVKTWMKKKLKVDYFLPFLDSQQILPHQDWELELEKYSEGQTGNLRNKLKWNICDW